MRQFAMKKYAYLFITGLAVLCLAGLIQAAEYVIGPGDVLDVRFWQDETLNAQVRVDNDGMISLDIVGSIKAAGKTPTELQNDIIRQMSRLNTRVSQATVRVVDYQYQYVFLKGQINNPGKHTFEEIPDLWTVINESGGITEFGDLSRVTIIRGGDNAGKVEIVNVLKAIESGQLDKLPKIGRGDTIDIPRVPSGLPSAEIGPPTSQKNEIYVIGAVNNPGPIQYQDNIDILQALALAGGPAENANLKKARIITKDGYYAQTIEVNLDKYSKTGTPARYIMRREDTFILPHSGGGFLGVGLGTAGTALGVISTAVLIYTALHNNNNNNNNNTSTAR